MSDRHQGRFAGLTRQITFLGGAAALTLLLVRWSSAAWTDLRTLPDTPTATPAEAIADVAAVLALVAWAWLFLGAIVTVLEVVLRMPGRPLVSRIAPPAWRRLVISAVGIGILSAPAGIAQASPGDPAQIASVHAGPDRGSPSATAPARAVRGLPLPDRPFGRLSMGSDRGTDRAAVRTLEPTQRVTVRPGDSLWAIAERHLGPRATAQDIAVEWRRWYAANRARIGLNPHLIHPGMVLHAPGRKAES